MASTALKIPISKIYISEASTNTVPNASPTAASVSSDINGQAVYVRSLGKRQSGGPAQGFGPRVPRIGTGMVLGDSLVVTMPLALVSRRTLLLQMWS